MYIRPSLLHATADVNLLSLGFDDNHKSLLKTTNYFQISVFWAKSKFIKSEFEFEKQTQPNFLLV